MAISLAFLYTIFMNFPTVTALNIIVSISPIVLAMLATPLLLLWLVYSVILRYHWGKYASGQLDVLKMNMIYFGGSAFLIVGMMVCLISYAFAQ